MSSEQARKAIQVTPKMRERLASKGEVLLQVRARLQQDVEHLELPSSYADFYEEMERIASFVESLAKGEKRTITAQEAEDYLSEPYYSHRYEKGVTPRFQEFVKRVNSDLARRLLVLPPSDPRRVSFEEALQRDPISDPNWLATHDLRNHLQNANLTVDLVRHIVGIEVAQGEGTGQEKRGRDDR